MKSWIDHPLNLEGDLVRLTGLERGHFNELIELAKDRRIWEHYTLDCSNSETLNSALDIGISERKLGHQYPFVIIHKAREMIVGSSRFLDIQEDDRKLEIGWTWLHPEFWGSAVNLECKLLLLTFCFENLKTIRVQLKTDENNLRSRKSIEKIGGQFEGILRNDMIREDGSFRNSAYYSITDNEWPQVKLNLTANLQHKMKFGK